MDINKIIQTFKQRSDFHKAGMVLVHNGVVRGTSRDGRRVSGLRISVDHDRLKALLDRERRTPGVLDIVVEIAENRVLSVGEDVMALAVAGDVRETVIGVLERTLNGIKTTVTQKTEFFIENEGEKNSGGRV